MRTSEPVTIQRADYAPPSYRHPNVHLRVELAEAATQVSATLAVEREAHAPADAPLRLDGVGLSLRSIELDGKPLAPQNYTHGDDALVLHAPPERFTLTTVVTLDPDANTALEGLYRSSGTFCTQCEAEGFRKITFALDRPDVLSVYDVEVIAAPGLAPVLLSNGNLMQERRLDDGRRLAHWHDPHPKPSYLFALVAGHLTEIDDRFVTASGREVRLSVYVEAHNASRCDFAMASLKHAMAWDERVYGLEYDLERYMIVAVDDFNMGAMENKGLNVFNSKFVLADLETATDTDFLWTEAVIAHEYFHNWTGNRITCRDWFQLSLKEGLTVFRDQSFTADRHSPTVKRIDDVRRLRMAQFPEDAGPLAHPIRPDSYIEINNFYTATVYEKGAEVIRMLATLIGREAFFAGMRVYVERHDGTAATCEHFVQAMEEASGQDLTQFRLWYSLAGTPVVRAGERWDAATGRLTLSLHQQCPDTPGQHDKPPMHMPVAIGLIDAEGRDVPGTPTMLGLTEREHTVHIDGLAARPVVSWLRGFSAPVRLDVERDVATLGFLAAHDSDGFNRWEAGQQLAHRAIGAQLDGGSSDAQTALVAMAGAALAHAGDDAALSAEALSLPGVDLVGEERERIDIVAIDTARESVMRAIATAHRDKLLTAVALDDAERGEPLAFGGAASARRALRAAAIDLVRTLDESDWVTAVVALYDDAPTMTDRIAALSALCHAEDARRDACLDDYLRRFDGNALAMDKWFALQARSRRGDTLAAIERLATRDDFDPGNPNRLRALISSFAIGNPLRFHAEGGAGYALLGEWIARLDTRNPQVAARLVAPLGRWRRFEAPAGDAMRATLQGLLDAGLESPDVYELVSRSLGMGPAGKPDPDGS